MSRPSTPALLFIGLVATSQLAAAQQLAGPTASCLTPDSLEFVGSTHRTAALLREDAGLPVGQAASATAIQRAVKNLYATGQFEDVTSSCRAVGGKVIYTFVLKDRPLLAGVDVTGVNRLSAGEVRDRVDLIIGRPVDPAQVARDVATI